MFCIAVLSTVTTCGGAIRRAKLEIFPFAEQHSFALRPVGKTLSSCHFALRIVFEYAFRTPNLEAELSQVLLCERNIVLISETQTQVTYPCLLECLGM